MRRRNQWIAAGLVMIAATCAYAVLRPAHDDLAPFKPYVVKERIGYEDVPYILETYPSVPKSEAKTTAIRTIRVRGLSKTQVTKLIQQITIDRSKWEPPIYDSELFIQCYGRESGPSLVDLLRPQIVAYEALDSSEIEIVQVRQLSQSEIWFRRIIYIGRNPFPRAPGDD